MKAKAVISAVSMVLLLAAGGIFAVCSNKMKNNADKNKSADNTEMTTTEAVTEEPFIPPVYIECTEADIHRGNLILVNRDYEYKEGSNPNIVNIYSNKSESYKVNTVDMMLDKDMINAINSMLDDFASETGITDVLANSGYRSYSEQQIMYENDLETTGLTVSELVAPPGNSEHHTGYAMDFAIDDGFAYPALKNTGEYSWIYDNAHKYGMILRYTEQNKHITGYMAESWHFRYVGPVHASLIRKMGVAYEEYVGFLKDFSFENPLEYKYSDNEFYRIYYVPADTENEKTDIPITFEAFNDKDGGYSVSGNNADGFIVTLKVSELSDDYDEAYLYMFNPIEEAVPSEEYVTELPEEELPEETEAESEAAETSVTEIPEETEETQEETEETTASEEEGW